MKHFYPKTGKHVKIHLLSHIAEQFQLFAGLAMYSVEVAECLNGDSRHCLMCSNRQNPSRDVALSMSLAEFCRDLIRDLGEMEDFSKKYGLGDIFHANPEGDSDRSQTRKKAGRYYFYDSWTKVGFIRSINQLTAIVSPLILNGHKNRHGIPLRWMGDHVTIRLVSINGQADVFHDCWGGGCTFAGVPLVPEHESISRVVRNEGRVCNLTWNSYLLNPFRLEEHHSLPAHELLSIVQHCVGVVENL